MAIGGFELFLKFSSSKHGASVNAMDLWQFTPLHEAASKARYRKIMMLFCICVCIFPF